MSAFNDLNNKLIVVVPFSSHRAAEEISHDYPNVKLIIGEYVDPILTDSQFCIFRESFNLKVDNFNDLMLNKFGCWDCEESLDKHIPIYFDHKIANNCCTFKGIYDQVIKQSPTRSKILEIDLVIRELILEVGQSFKMTNSPIILWMHILDKNPELLQLLTTQYSLLEQIEEVHIIIE